MSLNVLVADDSDTMRRLTVRALETLGIRSVSEAVDGRQAIALFRPDTFDLILTDWHMPVLTGVEVTREIRRYDKNIPIIMLTAESEPGRLAIALDAGVTDIVIKPFTPQALQEKIDEHVFAEA